ncbi:MAG TPA: hypothetical protein VGR72_01590 [Candidatus Acidoferrales bacterium]|nr:hypothetical protein [Candidatus Acidoferrales bacterium]
MASLALEISKSNSPSKPWMLPIQGMAVYYGCPQIYKLSHYFLPRVLLEGRRVLYLDGANRFDPLLLVRLARQRGHDAQEFNRNIRVARAFTCFQLTELLRRAPRLLEGFPADVAVVTALPELYFDEDVREPDAVTSFRQGLRALRELAGRLPVAVFSDPASFPASRRKLFEQLKACAGQVWKLTVNERSTPAINERKTVPSTLFSAGG